MKRVTYQSVASEIQGEIENIIIAFLCLFARNQRNGVQRVLRTKNTFFSYYYQHERNQFRTFSGSFLYFLDFIFDLTLSYRSQLQNKENELQRITYLSRVDNSFYRLWLILSCSFYGFIFMVYLYCVAKNTYTEIM